MLTTIIIVLDKLYSVNLKAVGRFKWLDHRVFGKHRKLCSVWKFYKYASLISQKIRKALKNTDQMEKILIRSLEIAPRQFKLEKKKDKLSQNEHLCS